MTSSSTAVFDASALFCENLVPQNQRPQQTQDQLQITVDDVLRIDVDQLVIVRNEEFECLVCFSSRATRIFGFLLCLKLTFCFRSASNSAIGTTSSSRSFATSLMLYAASCWTFAHFVNVFCMRTQCGRSPGMVCNGSDVIKLYGFQSMKVLLKALRGRSQILSTRPWHHNLTWEETVEWTETVRNDPAKEELRG